MQEKAENRNGIQPGKDIMGVLHCLVLLEQLDEILYFRITFSCFKFEFVFKFIEF